MSLQFNEHEPVYIQLLQHFRMKIASGEWSSGSKMESVRNMALEYEVNPNTVQRALQELEREDLAYSERTSGRYITINEETIIKLKTSIANEQVNNFVLQMKQLNLSKSQITKLLEDAWKG